MKAVRLLLVLLYFVLSAPVSATAQEEAATVYQGKKYIDLRLKAIEKYNRQIERQQSRLLKKLQRKEKKFAHHLQHKDSAAYVKYSQQQPSYKDIQKQSRPDSATLHSKTARKNNSTIDTLKNIRKFVDGKEKALEDKAHVTGEGKGNSTSSYADNLREQKARMDYRKYISEQIDHRTKALKEINGSVKGNVKGFKSIDKNVFYSNSKLSSFKAVMNEPSTAEDMALEYLQGTEGFDQALRGDHDMSALNGMSASQLEKMGYQTKRQVSQHLQKKFGGNLGGLQDNMRQQVQQFNEQTKKLNELKNKARKAKQVKQTAQNARRLRYANINKPSFKVNPMRGKPFAERIEKQINWQTTRATLNGQPAIFQISAMAGFKHTEKLSYGIGIAPAIGLGNGWNDIHFSFQGIGLRTYATWQWQYGIGVYAGYERMYKQAAFLDSKEAVTFKEQPHNQQTYNESVLIGLTKSYHISEKWSGSIQLLYDAWWKDKGLRSPLILRFATLKN